MPITLPPTPRDDAGVENHESPHQRAELRRDAHRLRALELAISERDETIRLLNEALSRALAELDRLTRESAA